MKKTSRFLIAAPHSGSGKTTLCRGLMALYKAHGLSVQPFKCGPDYIDTKYHSAVCQRASVNLDTFMASPGHVRKLYRHYACGADVAIVEGMMGLFDGYERDKGSSAEIAQVLDLPVVLVVDAKSAAYSIAPLLKGFIHFNPDVNIMGVIFNKVGSERHYKMLRNVCEELQVTCFGYLPKQRMLEQDSRYLGLDFSKPASPESLEGLVRLLEEHVDWKGLLEKTCRMTDGILSHPVRRTEPEAHVRPTILVARNEESFSFIYQEHLDILNDMGEVVFFNPEDDAPIPSTVDLLYLPGGYPEKHAVRLSAAGQTLQSIAGYVNRGGKVLAECGGMIYLSRAIVDDEEVYRQTGEACANMAGVFPFYIVNDPKKRRLSLGYRKFRYNGLSLKGHEFHYTRLGQSDVPASVAQVCNALNEPVDTPIFRYKNVIASYTHLYWGEIDLMQIFK